MYFATSCLQKPENFTNGWVGGGGEIRVGNSEIRQNAHFISHFALRVLACAKISKSRIIRYAHGVI